MREDFFEEPVSCFFERLELDPLECCDSIEPVGAATILDLPTDHPASQLVGKPAHGDPSPGASFESATRDVSRADHQIVGILFGEQLRDDCRVVAEISVEVDQPWVAVVDGILHTGLDCRA